ncbi:hypothetical protein [Actinoplanes sp. NPDC026623]|uniref:hypothetical protein n=1 Tax=Actinoplanes sp. NPDC026623 TaxID=3155610 RepID=UPI003411ED83
MYEDDVTERLIAALTAAFGDRPRWELSPNRSHGYYLWYDQGHVGIGEIRDVIDSTLRHEAGVILAPRGPRPGEFPPLGGM